MGTEETPDTGNDEQTDVTDTDTEGLKAELEKWKATSRKHEERSKANATAAKELEELRKASMNDQEKAVAAARDEARAEALREFGGRVVDSEIKVAFAGRDVDVAAILEGLDRSKFITDTGDPDVEAITAWRDRVAPVREETRPPGYPDLGKSPDLGQGPRGGQKNVSLNDDPMLKALVQQVGTR